MTRRLFTMGASAMVMAVTSMLSISLAGQEPPKRPKIVAKAEASRSYVPPRTPWGDPNLQGNYTNKYEQSTPFERPPAFVGRRLEDLIDVGRLAQIIRRPELEALDRRRNAAVAGQHHALGRRGPTCRRHRHPRNRVPPRLRPRDDGSVVTPKPAN